MNADSSSCLPLMTEVLPDRSLSSFTSTSASVSSDLTLVVS